MDFEPRHFRAISAATFAHAGEFVLCGLKLEPFCFLHSMALDALEIALWQDGESADFTDFVIVALICSQRGMTGFVSASKVSRERMDELVMALEDDALERWQEYIATCYSSRARKWISTNNGPSAVSKAPLEEYVVNYIMRHANGFTRDELLHRPCSEVFWIMDSIREQESGRSLIISEAEHEAMEKENEPEEIAKAERKNKLAAQIFDICKARGRGELVTKLLGALEEGTLPKNWRSTVKKKGGATCRK